MSSFCEACGVLSHRNRRSPQRAQQRCVSPQKQHPKQQQRDSSRDGPSSIQDTIRQMEDRLHTMISSSVGRSHRCASPAAAIPNKSQKELHASSFSAQRHTDESQPTHLCAHHCPCCIQKSQRLESLEMDVRSSQQFVEVIRQGFMDLCVATRDDIRDMQCDMERRFHVLEGRLMKAVHDAVHSQQRYQRLIQEEEEYDRRDARWSSGVPPFRSSSSDSAAAAAAATTGAVFQNEAAVRRLEKDLTQLKRRLDDLSGAGYHRLSTDGGSASERNPVELNKELHQVSNHVHALTQAHQTLIQTVVDQRCSNLEARLQELERHMEGQLVQLRSRCGHHEREVREQLHELHVQLLTSTNVSSPPLPLSAGTNATRSPIEGV